MKKPAVDKVTAPKEEKIFICMDKYSYREGAVGIGDDLQSAYKDGDFASDNLSPSECTFYRAVKIKVKTILIEDK